MVNQQHLNLINEARDSSLKNGEEYYLDALCLFLNDRNYGHIYALCVLAEEEIGKAFYYHTISNALQLELTHLVQSNKKKRNTITVNHKKKQYLQALMWYTVSKVSEAIKKGEFGADGPDNEEEALDFVNKLSEGPIPDHILDRYGNMQSKKEVAMYIDIEYGNVIGPDDFTQENAKEELKMTSYSLLIAKNMIKNWQPAGHQISAMKKYIDELDPEGKGIEMYGIS